MCVHKFCGPNNVRVQYFTANILGNEKCLQVPYVICTNQFDFVIMGIQDAFNFVLQNPLVTGTIEYVKVVVSFCTLYLCLPLIWHNLKIVIFVLFSYFIREVQ